MNKTKKKEGLFIERKCKICKKVCEFLLVTEYAVTKTDHYDFNYQEWVFVVEGDEVFDQEYFLECKECGDTSSLSSEEAEKIIKKITQK